MRVLIGDTWTPGYLDAFRANDEYRIAPARWLELEAVRGVYFVRTRSIRMVWNYFREIGFREVLKKVISRGAEHARNDKYVAIGSGHIVEAPSQGAFRTGESVHFLAPFHPRCCERIVLPEALLVPAATAPRTSTIAFLKGVKHARRWWAPLAGWTRYSGRELDRSAVAALTTHLAAAIDAAEWHGARDLVVTAPEAIAERSAAVHTTGTRPSAVLFGYGNYAKTLILPNLSRYVDVRRIHEIDPTQIPAPPTSGIIWDTAPAPRAEMEYDVLLAAGYHHSHAALACTALDRGGYAVVEKPLATTHSQLHSLTSAVQASPRLFACFQKRYSSLNELARDDLGVRAGEAVSYHCIVFEVPLPAMHWYRWPNSGSRVLSNGCHWTDHFLYLNDYAGVARCDLVTTVDGTINVTVELVNAATFTMVLTERGSERIGMQDYVELRANGATVRILNGTRYEAERSDRLLRRVHVNKVNAYRRMYRTIGRRIASGEGGDSIRSIAASAELALTLETMLDGVGRTEGAHRVIDTGKS